MNSSPGELITAIFGTTIVGLVVVKILDELWAASNVEPNDPYYPVQQEIMLASADIIPTLIVGAGTVGLWLIYQLQ